MTTQCRVRYPRTAEGCKAILELHSSDTYCRKKNYVKKICLKINWWAYLEIFSVSGADSEILKGGGKKLGEF